MSKTRVSKQIFDTRLKCVMGVLASLAVAYIMGSRAIDTGSWWQYFATMALLLLTVKLIVRAFKYHAKR